MFKSLSDALRSLFGSSTNDIDRIPVGSKRKRNTDENLSCDPDLQITRVEKKRCLESDISTNSLSRFETLKRSAYNMANFVKPKHSFQKDFNVQPIDPQSRWGERSMTDRNGSSNQSFVNGDANKRVPANHNYSGQKAMNSGQSSRVTEPTKHESQQSHKPLSFLGKSSKTCMISQCIRLNEKANYQKLLQMQCSQLWTKKVPDVASNYISTCTAGSKNTDSITASSNSSFCDTSASSTSSFFTPGRKILQQGKLVSQSRFKERPAVIDEQPKRTELRTSYFRPYGVKKVTESPRGQENKQSLVEKNVTSVPSDAIVIIDDDDVPVNDVTVKSAPCNKDERQSQEMRKEKRFFQQSKYFNDKEIEDKNQLRMIERERIKRLIEEEEIKASAYREKRRAQELSLEKKLKYQMRIFDDEPGITEELFREESDEETEEALPVLTKEMDKAIDYALASGNPNEVLSEAFRLQITRRDIATLKGLSWLNDEVINFYMNMLMERGERSNSKVYAFNTFFYPKIMSGGHSAVRRWTKSVDIFSKKYIIIPVHLSMHWCLCIVNMEEKVITYFDSMGGKNPNCLRAVLNYLRDESVAKNQPQFKEKEWELKHAEDNPQQMNGGDCGMFMCKYAEYITRGKEITFTQEHMPYFRRRMVYEIVSKKLLQ